MAQSLEKEPQKTTQPTPENPWLELIKTLAIAGILATGIRCFVAEARYIPSSSMEPTLLINDRLIVEKISYHLHDPKRGDIVVFYAPQKAGRCMGQTTAPKDAFIKRIIGLPGDTIAVSNGTVYINGGVMTENYIAQKPNYEFGPVQVPQNEYLVFGDNRNNSCDSHYWGFVPRKNLIGRAFVRFWPLNRLGMLDNQSGEQPNPKQSLPQLKLDR